MKKNFFSILLIQILIAIPLYGHAQQFCQNLFSVDISTAQQARVFGLSRRYHDKFSRFKMTPENIGSFTETIKQAARRLLTENKEALKRKYYDLEVPVDLSVYDIRFNDSNYAQITFKIRGDYISIRSNGYVHFLDASWMYRTRDHIQNYTVIYSFEGKLFSMNQAEFFLSTMKDQITLSRTMSQKEKEHWLDGTFTPTETFGKKVHFAENYFRYNLDEDPTLFTLKKSELIEAYKQGWIEINTYDMITDHYGAGGIIPEQFRENRRARIYMPNEIHIETEVVFLGDRAVEWLKPILKKSVQQSY